ncbi:hypothetical protein SAMN05421820_107176 [Pedobacter steynii]|uniref:Uncharacterized protein n=1 Tax=Pedobacter steynii TaxID=430522 RepID=A0A1H0AR76_9SPHI|nr:hypothetical protein [Pedobacter steynii]NQX41284.1 hypothetical protein [Pedobacter steynii]SDN35977.1 hypothetical protein SAMN05421820_107176 [Pedobacter steynii]
MNINNLRLKYEISQNTRLDLYIVHQRAISELREDKYRITQQTDKRITFDNSGPPRFEMRGASASKLQTGILELFEAEENNVKLTYFVSYKYILLALATILILTCLYSVIMLVLGAFLIITFGIELVSQKSNAEEFIARILIAENSEEIVD